MKKNCYILGVDIGGTKTSVVIGDTTAKIYKKITFPTCAEKDFDYTFGNICNNIKKLIKGWNLDCIGISIGGPLDTERGIIYNPPNLPNWSNIPLKDLLEAEFSLPVFIEHDGNAGALAEFLFGCAREYRNIIFMTFGTGLGAGLILDGKLYRGTTDTAGEIGHIRMGKTGPFAYGKKGSWESFCSGPSLLKIAEKSAPGRFKTTLELVDAAKAGDCIALKVIHKSAVYLGRGLAILIDILNPQIIIIGGMAIRLKDILLEPARKVAKKESLECAFYVCKIVQASLGECIGDIAALA
ncbi:MAG: ROK family protein, partial [Candidatus Ratteibacteria bacterium]